MVDGLWFRIETSCHQFSMRATDFMVYGLWIMVYGKRSLWFRVQTSCHQFSIENRIPVAHPRPGSGQRAPLVSRRERRLSPVSRRRLSPDAPSSAPRDECGFMWGYFGGNTGLFGGIFGVTSVYLGGLGGGVSDLVPAVLDARDRVRDQVSERVPQPVSLTPQPQP